MTSLLTNIAGQFAKPLLLSALLPIIVVASVFLLLTDSLLPLKLPQAVAGLDASWQVVWSTLFALVGAMILYVLNTWIARLFAGYPWKDIPPGTVLLGRQRSRYRRLCQSRDRLVALSEIAEDVDSDPLVERLTAALSPLAQELSDGYPYDEEQVMPTRLGNVIGNFEDYARAQYGISAVPLWPRLVGVLDPRNATVLDDAKTSFDFALNCLFLLCGAAALTLGLAIARGGNAQVMVAAGLRVAVFLVLAGVAYGAAVDRAQEWGTHVKAAIDLHRRELLKRLGYDYTLADIADEKERIWSVLASEWRFPDLRPYIPSLRFMPAPIPPAPPFTVTGTGGQSLVVLRGVGPPSGKPYPEMTVTLRVQNEGTEIAQNLTVTDTIPPGWSFVWGSATASTGALSLKGTLPVTFEVDQLAAASACTIVYKLQSLAAVL